MSFIKIKKDAKELQEGGGGSYISKSGIYPVTIKFVSVKANEHNARALDFNVDYNGNATTLYDLKLENNDGSENYQADVFHKLCNVIDLESIADPVMEEHKVGKDQTLKDFAVLSDFTDVEVLVRVQEEFNEWNGDIRRKLVIKNFYRAADGATASEILSEGEVGLQIEKDRPYAEKPAYRDGLTAERVQECNDSKAKGAPTATTAATPTKTAPAANLFGKK